MITPKDKSKRIDNLLANKFGVHREQAILDEVCVPSPIGCGQAVTKFNDELSAKEYSISGLCQQCQDNVFDAR